MCESFIIYSLREFYLAPDFIWDPSVVLNWFSIPFKSFEVGFIHRLVCACKSDAPEHVKVYKLIRHQYVNCYKETAVKLLKIHLTAYHSIINSVLNFIHCSFAERASILQCVFIYSCLLISYWCWEQLYIGWWDSWTITNSICCMCVLGKVGVWWRGVSAVRWEGVSS